MRPLSLALDLGAGVNRQPKLASTALAARAARAAEEVGVDGSRRSRSTGSRRSWRRRLSPLAAARQAHLPGYSSQESPDPWVEVACRDAKRRTAAPVASTPRLIAGTLDRFSQIRGEIECSSKSATARPPPLSMEWDPFPLVTANRGLLFLSNLTLSMLARWYRGKEP